MAVTKLESVTVFEVEWTSPAWQLKHLKAFFKNRSTGVIPFAKGAETNLLALAVRNGFWALPKSYVDAVAMHRQVQLGVTLF